MKINTRKSSSLSKSKVAVIVAAVLVVALAAGSFVYVYAFNGNLFGWTIQKEEATENNDGINYDPPTDEEITAGNAIKQESINENEQPSPSSTIDLSITALNQTSDTLQVRVLIPSIVSSGTCTLTLNKGSNVVTRSVDVQALSNASTCKGFDIPLTEISLGVWNATVSFENQSQKGTTSNSVEIK